MRVELDCGMKRVFEFRPDTGCGAGISVDQLTKDDEPLTVTLPTGQTVVVDVPQALATSEQKVCQLSTIHSALGRSICS